MGKRQVGTGGLEVSEVFELSEVLMVLLVSKWLLVAVKREVWMG